jgi:hypothetical protein
MERLYCSGTVGIPNVIVKCDEVEHPLRLRVDLIWSEMEERDSQVLVCALATLDRRIAPGEQLMVGFC